MRTPVAALVIAAAIISVLVILCTPRSTSRSSAISSPGSLAGRSSGDTMPRAEVRVLVLDFDPVIPDSGRRRAHRAFGWGDPRQLADGYAEDVRAASGGRMSYRVVEWRTLDEFPVKRDGFRYTPASYASCLRLNTTCHNPDALDYEAMIRQHRVAALVDSDKVDEVW